MDEREDRPSILMHALFHSRRQAIQTELIRLDLRDLGQPMILFMLRERGRGGRVAAQRELADALHVSPATIAVSLRSLERAGYVEKRLDEADQRRKTVQLTPKGDLAISKCIQAYRRVDDSMFLGFSPEELQELRSYHMRMLRNLQEKLPPERRGCPC